MDILFQDFFKQKKPDLNALKEYGFQLEEDHYVWSTPIVDNSFILTVSVFKNGQVNIEVQDVDTKEPYTLYQTKASGEYVGKVREEIEDRLQDIANHCFVSNIFKDCQSLAVIDYIQNHYHASLEFLWEKYPDVAIWRHNNNDKWFGLITHLALSKLGINSQKEADILILHLPKDITAQEFQSKEKDVYPAWHMNKTHWYSTVLNNWLSDEEVFKRIDTSFESTKK